METKGILKQVSEVIERGQNGQYTSRKIWLTLDAKSQYPQTVEFEVSGTNTNLFNNIALGSEVSVQFNLKGREWTKDGKTSVFNTLQIWKVAVDGKPVDAGGYYANQVTNNQPASSQNSINDEEDANGLPF